ncbi:MAG: DUF2867 domain-containing protein [Rhodococcus sp.]|nr:DUF2867 domain-containing protein [Rhodococcus sp. (in: high G+C Gram-positive bacteria)]
MRLPVEAHSGMPWRIHDIAPDFRIYDVWALPTPGGPEDFPLLKQQFMDGDIANNPSPVARTLFAIRWRLGEWFGWDDEEASVGNRVPSLRDRLPENLRAPVADPTALPFATVFETENEWAAEMANSTVHCVMHVGWVPDDTTTDGYRGQMAVLVKPNGVWGRAYMAAIAPFRHVLVYPPLMRGIAAVWDGRAPGVTLTRGQQAIPNSVRVRLLSQNFDYVDTNSLAAAADRTAEWWARTMFEELITTAGRESVFGGLLRLTPESGGQSLAGWKVVENTPHAVALTRAGRHLACEMHVVVTDDAVHLALAVRYRTRLGAAIWRPASSMHRRFGKQLLLQAWQAARDQACPTIPLD